MRDLIHADPTYVELLDQLEARMNDLNEANESRAEAMSGMECWRGRCLEVERRLNQCQGRGTGLDAEALKCENVELLERVESLKRALDLAYAQLDIVHLIFGRSAHD